ncbi:MAG: ABC transporter ATP-binding protein [Chitinophagaceae bacterium]|nr:MAG: ABC transporter ATP-binding protein [Chitinophagaceae bacterium]
MKNPYFSLLKTSWKYSGNQRKRFILIYVLFIFANIIYSLNPLVLGWFIGKAQNDSKHVLQYTLYFVATYFLMKFAEWCFHGPARIMERTLAFTISRNYMHEKYHKTLHLPVKWHQDNHSGATINRIRKAYDALRGFFDGGFSFIHTFSKFVFSVTAIVIFSPLFGTIAVAIGFITVFVIARFDKPYIKTLKEVNEKENKVTANLFDSLSNIRSVITLRLENSMEKGLLNRLKKVALPFRKNAIINEWKWFTAEMMITMIYCVIVLGYVYQNWTPGTTFAIAGMVTLLGYVNQFTSVFQNVASQYSQLVQYHTNMEGAADISESFEKQHRPDSVMKFPQGWQKMEISNLSFSHRASYEEEFRPQSLHQLNLELHKGKKIALIGESGSGKSTLMSVLRGLYAPGKSASVIVDGSEFSMDSINQSATLFPQEPEIFENTIRYNITLGLPCNDDEIRRVSEIAHLNEVINQMPEGLMTDIREKGVNLSGGQKQRLALARGVLAARDSDIILLDEPTSSIDPKTEFHIYNRLFEAFEDKVVISSIHRLHLLDNFDYIYILDKGKIIAEGSFEKLLADSEVFRGMWNHQAGGQVLQMTA